MDDRGVGMCMGMGLGSEWGWLGRQKGLGSYKSVPGCRCSTEPVSQDSLAL